MKIAFKKILFIKNLVLKEMKSQMKLNSEHLFEHATLEYNMENAIISRILPKYSSMRIQLLQNWYSKCNSKEICLATSNGRVI